MDHAAFKQAWRFASQDVQREICLARVSMTEEGKRTLREVGVEPGGGNFMAALALLCYTEFAGKLKFKCKKQNGRDHASKNFNLFFDELGPGYEAFRASCPYLYDIFRCGLAHEYYVRKSCTIYMLRQHARAGIGQEEGGKYYFVVEQYYQDLERAFAALEAHLFPGSAGNDN